MNQRWHGKPLHRKGHTTGQKGNQRSGGWGRVRMEQGERILEGLEVCEDRKPAGTGTWRWALPFHYSLLFTGSSQLTSWPQVMISSNGEGSHISYPHPQAKNGEPLLPKRQARSFKRRPPPETPSSRVMRHKPSHRSRREGRSRRKRK